MASRIEVNPMLREAQNLFRWHDEMVLTSRELELSNRRYSNRNIWEPARVESTGENSCIPTVMLLPTMSSTPRQTSDVVIEVELVRMGAEPNRIDFVLPFVRQPGVDQPLGEHTTL